LAPAGANSYAPVRLPGNPGESCSATCSSSGLVCSEGDWGVHHGTTLSTACRRSRVRAAAWHSTIQSLSQVGRGYRPCSKLNILLPTAVSSNMSELPITIRRPGRQAATLRHTTMLRSGPRSMTLWLNRYKLGGFACAVRRSDKTLHVQCAVSIITVSIGKWNALEVQTPTVAHNAST
jgi:hypothetical protein